MGRVWWVGDVLMGGWSYEEVNGDGIGGGETFGEGGSYAGRMSGSRGEPWRLGVTVEEISGVSVLDEISSLRRDS